MAKQLLGQRAVGSTVHLKVGGKDTDFLIVHQGNPAAGFYDASCDGVWLLTKDCYEERQWHRSNVNDYAGSTIHGYLNGEFLRLFEADIQAAIKQVKIPYRPGAGTSATVNSGADGLPCRIFLLGGYELGWTTSDYSDLPVDGAKLSYFDAGTSAAANQKRIANFNGAATRWFLRSADLGYRDYAAWSLSSGGVGGGYGCSGNYGIRPALILPATLLVSEDGAVSVNSAPSIDCAQSALGVKTGAFSVPYTVRDADGDAVTVTESVDGAQKRSYAPVLGQANQFSVDDGAFLRLLNGAHTLEIAADDGAARATHRLTFTKAVHEATVTLAQPMRSEKEIALAALSVTGVIPSGAELRVEVTNNAADPNPTWQDATAAVQAGESIVFENHAAGSGFAFNFRVTVKRGTSAGGYLTSIQGGFQ